MIPFLHLPEERRRLILQQTANTLGLPEQVVEKDFWVTLALKAVFDTETGKHLVFKGGTSLSKGWGVIDRFSEDIDLALDREFLNFPGALGKSQRDRLRQTSCKHITTVFIKELTTLLASWGVRDVTLIADECNPSDKDPVQIRFNYESLFEPHSYLPDRVLLEVGCRSLMEPNEPRSITSMIAAEFPPANLLDGFEVPCVLPKRTFLEKCILLHEEFHRPPEKARHEKRSRHLYDIARIMDTQHGSDALMDKALFEDIVSHRMVFTKISGVDYEALNPQTLDFVPPEDRIEDYKKDYNDLRQAFFQAENPLSFEELMKKLEALRTQFRAG